MFLIFFFVNSWSKSKYIFPEQNITLLEADLELSTITFLNVPSVKSLISDVASGFLSKLFGVKTIKGFLEGLTTCLLSKWNICVEFWLLCQV